MKKADFDRLQFKEYSLESLRLIVQEDHQTTLRRMSVKSCYKVIRII